MDAVLLPPYAPRGTVVDDFVHSIPLTIDIIANKFLRLPAVHSKVV
jgi:hypothetical protein